MRMEVVEELISYFSGKPVLNTSFLPDTKCDIPTLSSYFPPDYC